MNIIKYTEKIDAMQQSIAKVLTDDEPYINKLRPLLTKYKSDNSVEGLIIMLILNEFSKPANLKLYDVLGHFRVYLAKVCDLLDQKNQYLIKVIDHLYDTKKELREALYGMSNKKHIDNFIKELDTFLGIDSLMYLTYINKLFKDAGNYIRFHC